MAGHKMKRFGGLYPRVPDSELPPTAASVAQNCDLAYGELRHTKGGFKLNFIAMLNEPQSIYTDDGLSFYTWEDDVYAVRSPLVSDTFNRLYYSDASSLKVARRDLTGPLGGPPGTYYTVGVPAPTASPTLSIAIPDLTDTAKYALVFKVHLEFAGVKYQEATVTPTGPTDGKYQLTPPTASRQVSAVNKAAFPATGEAGVVYEASDTGTLYLWSINTYVVTTTSATPTDAFVVVRITATLVADSSQVFDIYSDNSSLAGTGGIWTATAVKDEGAATYTVTLTAAIKEADKETRAYVYTFVNTYDEEGPPSKPVTVTTSPIVGVTVNTTLDGNGFYVPFKEIRLYRTPTGSTVAEYFYVGTITVLGSNPGAFTFLDNVKAEMLNEPLSSVYYLPPPTGLKGLMSLPNGILCAHKGNELWFSEAYKPHAWPPSYVKPLAHTIVGSLASGAGAIVTTVAEPYFVYGVSPDSMSTALVNVDQAGVSPWSIAVVDGAVIYASHDGLVVVNGNSASLKQGQRFFTREVWRARYGAGLAGMRFSVWDGRLIVFHAAGTFTPFMLQFDEADGTMTELPDFVAACAFVSVLSDQCYYALHHDLYAFNGGTDATATWQSGELVLDRPDGLGVMQAVVTGVWTVTITAALTPLPGAGPDPAKFVTDALVGQWTLTTNSTEIKASTIVYPGSSLVRLPPGFVSDRWRVKLSGTGRFRELRLATNARMLAQL